MPASKPIPFEGVLNCWNDEHDLPDLLLAVSRSGKTGRLKFSNAEADKTLYIKEGAIVFAESSSDDDGLGQHLLRVGKISLEDYLRVSKMVEPGKRLGALLVAENVLEPKELVPAVVGQVRDIILGLFRRTESWYGFKEEPLTRKESITLDIPVAQIILDGVQQVDSWRRVSKGVGALEDVYRIVDARRKEWIKVDPSLSELLAMLETPVSVAHICTHARMGDFDACRYLWAFRTLGWIETAPVEEEAAAAFEDADDELDEDALVEAAAASADRAEVSEATPVPPAIPERLIQTRISTRGPEAKPSPTPPQPPRPVPEDLSRTQMAVEPPRRSPETTSPDVSSKPKPKPIPDDPVHTRLDVSETPPPEERRTTLSTPSAAEMMESILEDGAPRPAPPPRSDAATQFFAGPSAFEEPEPPPSEESDPFAAVSYDSFDEMPFETPAPAVPEAPPAAATTVPSFEDLALSDPALPVSPPSEEEPEPDAEPSLPVLEGDVVEPEPLPAEGGGMEFLMSNDPLVVTEENSNPPAFTTHDPLQFGEEPVAAALPKRPRTDEMELDADGLGHILRRKG